MTDNIVWLAHSGAAACAAIGSMLRWQVFLGFLLVSQRQSLWWLVLQWLPKEKCPLVVANGTTDWVDHFPYLGYLVTENRRVYEEVERRIANASKAFGGLQRPVFKDPHLSVDTKQQVYRACVLSVLL